jgi:hypothetical protein
MFIAQGYSCVTLHGVVADTDYANKTSGIRSAFSGGYSFLTILPIEETKN